MSDRESHVPPPPGPPTPPAHSGSDRRGLFIGGGAVVAAVVVAVVLVLVLGGSSSSASTPKAAVKQLLDAGKADDVGRAKKVLCKEDQTSALLEDVDSGGRIESYTIGDEKTINGQRVVSATYTDDDGTQTVPFPVVKEGGNWRVCLSKIAATVGVPSTFPTPPGSDSSGSGSASAPQLSTPAGSGSEPTGVALCAAAANGYQAASSYVGAALAGLGSVAESCVYQKSVPQSVTDYLKGKFFVPSTTDETATDIKFASTDGTSMITVSTKMESDGHWYVVGVKTG